MMPSNKPHTVHIARVFRGIPREAWYFANGGIAWGEFVVPGSKRRADVEAALIAAGYKCVGEETYEYRLGEPEGGAA